MKRTKYDRADPPNLNTGKPWSEASISDLRYAVTQHHSPIRTADFLCRTLREVRRKAKELFHYDFPLAAERRKRKAATEAG